MQLLLVFLACLVASSAIYWLVVTFWAWLLLIGAVVVAARCAWPALRNRWELRQIRAETDRALRRQAAAYDQAQARMEQVALTYRIQKGISE
jgi:hypothetical protein